jgi:hypothetical protein
MSHVFFLDFQTQALESSVMNHSRASMVLMKLSVSSTTLEVWFTTLSSPTSSLDRNRSSLQHQRVSEQYVRRQHKAACSGNISSLQKSQRLVVRSLAAVSRLPSLERNDSCVPSYNSSTPQGFGIQGSYCFLHLEWLEHSRQTT